MFDGQYIHCFRRLTVSPKSGCQKNIVDKYMANKNRTEFGEGRERLLLNAGSVFADESRSAQQIVVKAFRDDIADVLMHSILLLQTVHPPRCSDTAFK